MPAYRIRCQSGLSQPLSEDDAFSALDLLQKIHATCGPHILEEWGPDAPSGQSPVFYEGEKWHWSPLLDMWVAQGEYQAMFGEEYP